jgi:hypothetical protein
MGLPVNARTTPHTPTECHSTFVVLLDPCTLGVVGYHACYQCMLHFIFDSISELKHHIGLAAGPDGTCK